MEKSLVKKAFDEASKDIEKEKREKIKKIILETLRRKEEKKERVSQLQKEIKILNKDLEDFKQGRLDLIEERQKVDELARKISVVKVEKVIHEHHYDRPWYQPYWITYTHSDDCAGSATWTSDSSDTTLVNGFSETGSSILLSTGTGFHNNFSGSYDINGLIINL